MAVNKVIYGDQTLMDLTGDTVTADKLLSGATAHNASGEQITGSMTDKSGTSGTISTASDSFTIPQGYHDGQGTVSISDSEQAKIIPENIKSGVEILGVTGTHEGGGTDTSDATANALDILAGQTAYVDGEKVTGTMINRGQVTGSISYANDVFAISQGYHDGTGSVTIDSAEQAKIIPENIKSGVRILGVDGSCSGGGVDTSGDTVTANRMLAGTTAHDANGNAITGTMTNRGSFSATITRKDQVVTIPQGYHDGTGTVQISSSEQAKIISENIRYDVGILDTYGELEYVSYEQLDYSSVRSTDLTGWSYYPQTTEGHEVITSLVRGGDYSSKYFTRYKVEQGKLYYCFYRYGGNTCNSVSLFSVTNISDLNDEDNMINCVRIAPDNTEYIYFFAPVNGFLYLYTMSDGYYGNYVNCFEMTLDPH